MKRVIRKDEYSLEEKRIVELILFFSEQSVDDRFYGSAKLNKLLFLADFNAYGHLGKSITGMSYVHQTKGPTPRPGEFLLIRDRMISNGDLGIREEETYVGIRRKPIAQRAPDISIFSKDEIEICFAALEELKHLTATEGSEWSHKILGWLYTEEGETIPYSSIYLWTKIPLTTEDMGWAIQAATQLGV